jgi:hypothetical protein
MRLLARFVGTTALAVVATGVLLLSIGTHASAGEIAAGIICFVAVATVAVVSVAVHAFVAVAERVRHRRFAKPA